MLWGTVQPRHKRTECTHWVPPYGGTDCIVYRIIPGGNGSKLTEVTTELSRVCSVRYRYSWCRYGRLTELSKVSGTGIAFVPNLRNCPVPVLTCTDNTEVSGTGIDVVPNFPSCPVPVILAACLGTYSPEHTLLRILFNEYPLDYETEKKSKTIRTESLLELERRQIIWILLAASYANPIPKFISWSGRKNKYRLCKSNRAFCAKEDAEMVLVPYICYLTWFFSRSVRFWTQKV